MNDFDILLAAQHSRIEAVGWVLTAVLPTFDEPAAPFTYTVGLTAHNHPELLIVGLDPYIAALLLNEMAVRVLHGGLRLADGQRLNDLIADYNAVVREGHATGALIPGTAYARYGRERVRLAQIVWPCPRAHFPWEDGYCLPADAQPLLARP